MSRNTISPLPLPRSLIFSSSRNWFEPLLTFSPRRAGWSVLLVRRRIVSRRNCPRTRYAGPVESLSLAKVRPPLRLHLITRIIVAIRARAASSLKMSDAGSLLTHGSNFRYACFAPNCLVHDVCTWWCLYYFYTLLRPKCIWNILLLRYAQALGQRWPGVARVNRRARADVVVKIDGFHFERVEAIVANDFPFLWFGRSILVRPRPQSPMKEIRGLSSIISAN